MNSKVARLIITTACNRHCVGCCNSYNKIMHNAVHISDVSWVIDYPVVCVTGGEPMLEPDRTLDVVAGLRKQNPAAQIYLYTSLVTGRLPDFFGAVDGVQFTLHYDTDTAEKDVEEFRKLQNMLHIWGQPGSYRLNIDSRIRWTVPLIPSLWQRVKIMPWLSEDKLIEVQPNGLPAGETLFILED